MALNPTPPGWYPDGHGNTKYWDGTGWAEPAPTAPTIQIPAVPSATYILPPAHGQSPPPNKMPAEQDHHTARNISLGVRRIPRAQAKRHTGDVWPCLLIARRRRESA